MPLLPESTLGSRNCFYHMHSCEVLMHALDLYRCYSRYHRSSFRVFLRHTLPWPQPTKLISSRQGLYLCKLRMFEFDLDGLCFQQTFLWAFWGCFPDHTWRTWHYCSCLTRNSLCFFFRQICLSHPPGPHPTTTRPTA